jgi:hypothetical protein
MSIAALRAAVLAAAFASGIWTIPASTQPATGTCVLQPLTPPLFAGTPAAEVLATPMPPGAGANPDEAVIEAAIEDIVDCINTGEAAYQFAIFTERYLAAQFADPDTYQPEFEMMLTLEPAGAPARFELRGVGDISWLDDGRVSAVVDLASGSTTYRDTLILAYVDGTWLIDEVVTFDPPR